MKKRIYLFALLALMTSVLHAGITSIENNISQPILDNSCINKTFSMPTSTIITDVNIEVNLTHTWRSDLNLSLTSPLGTVVNLTNRNGSSADNIWVYFDDSAATSITTDSTTHTALVNRSPQAPLSAFNGEDPVGIWTLQICDNATFDTGTFNNARLEIDDAPQPIVPSLKVDYHFDECYWLNGAGGVIGDVKDSSTFGFNATSSAAATLTTNTVNPPLCNYGTFAAQPDLVSSDDATAGNTNNGLTISVWLNPQALSGWQAIVTKSKAYNWNNGWGLIHVSGNPTNEVRFFINDYSANTIPVTVVPNTWNHVVATYDKATLRIYLNGVEVGTGVPFAGTINNSGPADPIRIAYDDPSDAEYIGSVDELKVWDRAFTSAEITTLYTNESTGKDYNGTARICPTCASAPMVPASWELVGIPADLRTATNNDVANIFDEFNATTYDTIGSPTDWIVYQLDYNTSVSNGTYSFLPYTGVPLQFGKGYWIWSAASISWSENGLPGVDYNATSSACVSTTCVELDLVTPGLSGVTLNNMLSFVGNTPVDWADCRIIISDVNGTTAYTPSAAQTAGFIEKQVWQYNPGAVGANSNGYTTCDDTTPGGCKLEPYKGFWLRLKDATLNKTVKLLLPKE